MEFEPYARQVYAWAYRLLGRHHDALDVVQDVFLRWDEQCLSTMPDRPRGWLRRVTFNRAIDLFRKRGMDGLAARQPAPPQEVVAGLASPDRALLRADIAAALDELSEAQREVFVAKAYDEMTFAQIAAELEVSVPTAKTHYLRAVRALRDRLRPRWAEEGDR